MEWDVGPREEGSSRVGGAGGADAGFGHEVGGGMSGEDGEPPGVRGGVGGGELGGRG